MRGRGRGLVAAAPATRPLKSRTGAPRPWRWLRGRRVARQRRGRACSSAVEDVTNRVEQLSELVGLVLVQGGRVRLARGTVFGKRESLEPEAYAAILQLLDAERESASIEGERKHRGRLPVSVPHEVCTLKGLLRTNTLVVRGPSEVKERPQLVRALRREQRRLGGVVRRLRLANGMSREVAAERIGLSINQLGRLERGEANVTLATLVACAVGLQVDLPALFRREGEG